MQCLLDAVSDDSDALRSQHTASLPVVQPLTQ